MGKKLISIEKSSWHDTLSKLKIILSAYKRVGYEQVNHRTGNGMSI